MGLNSRGYARELGELTPRMRAVLRSAAAGATELETAAELGVGVTTVKTIKAAALERLGARNVVAAVATAIREGRL